MICILWIFVIFEIFSILILEWTCMKYENGKHILKSQYKMLQNQHDLFGSIVVVIFLY